MSFIYMDISGRKIIGELISEEGDVVKLKNPLVINESMRQISESEFNVDLKFSPYFHTFETKEMEFKWFSKLSCDEKLFTAYKDYSIKIKAQRAGINVVSSIPGNLPRVSNN